MPANQPLRDPPPKGEIALALGLLFGGTGALAILALAWPPISGWLQVLLAGMLLAIPGLVLRRAQLTVDHCGVQLGPWPRTAMLSTITMVIVFPLFVLGYHALQTQLLDREAGWSVDALARWDETLENPPRDACDPDRTGVRVWLAGDGLWIVPPPGGAALSIDVADRPTTARLARCDQRPRTGSAVRVEGTWDAPAGSGVWLSYARQDQLDVTIRLDGRPAEGLVGRYGGSLDDGRLRDTRSIWWLASFLIVHLGLVALPEEWFFRGYLQSRLDDRFGTRWRLFGASLGPGLVLSAAAFALLHPILVPGVDRLLVFFPALMFGWLRARAGNIGAAVVVHAGSNLLLAVVSRMYG